jgi:hypothetical protein
MRYALIFVDHGTDMVWDFYLTSKTNFGEDLKAFFALISSAGAGKVLRIQQLRSDSEPIYWTKANKKIAKNYKPAIIIEPTSPETPQLNGKVEATVNRLCGHARALLAATPWMPPSL